MQARSVCVSALVMTVFISGCSGDDGDDREESALKWKPIECPDDLPEGEVCAEGTEIAKVEVPLDYEDPDADTVELAVARREARKPSERIGTLFLNPGGPGGSAVELVTFLQANADIGDRFDLIGFDPRGVGQSEKLDCGIPAKELVAVDAVIDSPEEAQQLVDWAQHFADACESKHGELLAHMGTRDAARDMDHLRGLLGEETINYLGISYGTAIGQVYASMFPTRVRAMALDGVDDITRSGLDAAETVAFEQALQRFVGACTQQPDCALNPDPMTVVDQVQAATQQGTIPASSADRPLGPGEFQWGARLPLNAKDLWSQLADALATANAGDGGKLVALLDEFLGDANLDVAYAVECLDKDVSRGDAQTVLDAAKAAAARAPHFGEALVNRHMICAQWPTPAQPLSTVEVSGTVPPIVVVSTTNDPATPYQAGVDLARRLPQASLITHEGDGHTIYGQGSSCVDEAVDSYLVDPTRPPGDITCS